MQYIGEAEDTFGKTGLLDCIRLWAGLFIVSLPRYLMKGTKVSAYRAGGWKVEAGGWWARVMVLQLATLVTW